MNKKNSTKRFLHLLLLLVVTCYLSSCQDHYELELVVPDEDTQLMRDMINSINTHSRFNISIKSIDSLTEGEAIGMLLDGGYDLTTVDNTIDYRKSKKEIRTIIPFFHEVMVVLSRNKHTQIEIDSLLRAGDYLVLAKEEDELNIYKQMMPLFTGEDQINYRIEDHYDLEKDLNLNNLVIFFSDKENKEVGEFLFNEEAYIYSLDFPDSRDNGSFLEGFCRSYKKTTPYLLTKHAFGIVLREPIYTMAVHELLITSKSLPTHVVSDLMETFHHHHIVPIFDSYNTYTFEANHQDINLTFPFHEGTIDYMNREKPKFVERYADFMGFVLSACVLIIGLVASLKATINQRKKDRMDKYYDELLDLKEKLETMDNAVNQRRNQLKLAYLQKKVFDLLIDEKLSANNEFVIFMMLWQELDNKVRIENIGTDHPKVETFEASWLKS